MRNQKWSAPEYLALTLGFVVLLLASLPPSHAAGPDPRGFRPRCDFDAGAAASNRILAWDGSDSVTVDVPAAAHYRAGEGEGEGVSASGNADMLRHLRIRDGHIEFDCDGNWGNERLQIELPGRSFRGFAVGGTGTLMLEKIKQPSLNITLAGATGASAKGEVDHLNISVAGSGSLGAGSLRAKSVSLSIAGSGNVETAPQDDLHVNIVGSGTVRLVTEPRSIETNVVGSGQVIRSH